MLRIFTCCLLLFLAILLFGTSPHHPQRVDGGGDTLRYFFVGHAYNTGPGYSRIDPRVVGLDWSQFHKRVFGGDLNSEAMKYERYLTFMDSVFDLRSPHTMYVLGNHDARNENFEWYHKYTGRRTYYAYSDAGAVFVVLNTTLNAGNCEDLDRQYAMLKQICDTITPATSHLFIFSHHNLWHNIPGLPPPGSYSNWQMPYWDANCSGDTATYVAAVYPMLVDVQQRGVEVIHVLGDAGVVNKGNLMYSADSLMFFASGINNSRWFGDSLALDSLPRDKVLIFEHIPDERKVLWRFHGLDSLYQAHQ